MVIAPPEPIVVDLVRGPVVESTHLVHAVAVDRDDRVVAAWGDAGRLTHPRSAVKPVQALPLVETGAAAAHELTDRELALACSSHEGESGHVEAVEAWLVRIGCTVDDLECGAQEGRGPSPAANTCSGKHVGFLTVARHLGVDPGGYVLPDHPVQQLVTAALADVTGASIDPALAGTDGCGIPVHPVPLRAIALAAARFGAPPTAWPAPRAGAARRLAVAMVAEPWLVAGTGQLVTDLLLDAGGEVLVKDGAEGVQFAALPGRGIGIAVKAEDGSVPASEVALGHVLATVEGRPRPAVFDPRQHLANHAGTHVADLVVRPSLG